MYCFQIIFNQVSVKMNYDKLFCSLKFTLAMNPYSDESDFSQDDKILDGSKLKAFADDKLKVA